MVLSGRNLRQIVRSIGSNWNLPWHLRCADPAHAEETHGRSAAVLPLDPAADAVSAAGPLDFVAVRKRTSLGFGGIFEDDSVGTFLVAVGTKGERRESRDTILRRPGTGVEIVRIQQALNVESVVVFLGAGLFVNQIVCMRTSETPVPSDASNCVAERDSIGIICH